MFVRRLAFTAALALLPLMAEPAHAFCGFYVSGADAKLFNNATQVVLMREGTRTVLSMQNNYQGPPENFAMVVPVPVVLQKENVKTLPRDVFSKIDQLDAPRLVEYWEQDPCGSGWDTRTGKGGGMARPAPAPAGAKHKAEDLGVTIEAKFTVGEYEIVILSAKDSTGLDTWLKQESYKIPDGSEPYFRPYVQSGSKFFVARVDVKKVTFEKKENGQEMATLSPLRFHYDTETFSLPVRLGLVNSGGTQDLIVHILAKNQRYETANYPAVTIPTNLDVAENARSSFGAFYASLFDRTLEKNPKAVVTEYSWDATTCDPCPGPTLNGNDLATLGADALPDAKPPMKMQGPGGGGAPPQPMPPSRPIRVRMPPGMFGFTLTRLHARYSKDTLGEDLVFKAAPPIAGGRENRSADGTLEHGAVSSPVNNFQGRYAIRHPWGGPITCKEPKRGIWGGPPAYVKAEQGGSPKPALDLAFAKRDAKLPEFLRAEVPELGIKGEGVAVSSHAPPSSSATAAADGAPASSSEVVPIEAPKKTACGCQSASTSDLAGGASLVFLAGMFVRRRRR